MSMGEMKYKRVMKIGYGRNNRMMRGGRVGGGIRLNLKRFLVSSLRPRMLRLLRVLSRWRVKALQALRSLNFNNNDNNNNNNNNIRHGYGKRSRFMASDDRGYYCDRVRLKSIARSNSFYAEAIADCLDFIKRSSISVDNHHPHHNYNMPSTTYD